MKARKRENRAIYFQRIVLIFPSVISSFFFFASFSVFLFVIELTKHIDFGVSVLDKYTLGYWCWWKTILLLSFTMLNILIGSSSIPSFSFHCRQQQRLSINGKSLLTINLFESGGKRRNHIVNKRFSFFFFFFFVFHFLHDEFSLEMIHNICKYHGSIINQLSFTIIYWTLLANTR